jgi:hypothetical protein
LCFNRLASRNGWQEKIPFSSGKPLEIKLELFDLFLQLQSHEDNVRAIAVRVHEVIFQSALYSKAQLLEGVNDFRLVGKHIADQDVQALLAGQFDHGMHQFHTQAAPAEILGKEDADFANVTPRTVEEVQGSQSHGAVFYKRQDR